MESPGQLLTKTYQLLVREQGKAGASSRVRVPLERQQEVDLVSLRCGRAIFKVDSTIAGSARPLRQKPQYALLRTLPPESDDPSRASVPGDLCEAARKVDQALAKRSKIRPPTSKRSPAGGA